MDTFAQICMQAKIYPDFTLSLTRKIEDQRRYQDFG